MAKTFTVGFISVLVTIPTPARAVPITVEQKFTTDIEIHNPTGNSAIYFGNSDVSSSTHIPRAAGSTSNLSILDLEGEARHFDLSLIYITGTAGDVVRVQYRIRNPITKG